MFNSFYITLLTIVISLSLTATTSYSLSRFNFKGKNFVIGFLNRVKPALNDAVRKEARLKYSPTLSFAWDESLEKGHHILDMLHQLDEHKDLPEGSKE